MKCLFVASSMNFGGAERVMSILSNAWCDKNCEVKILLTRTPAQSKYELNKSVELLSCYDKVKKALIPHVVIMKSIRSLCKVWRPDVVISFYNDVAALTALAITGYHIPLIYSERNDPNRVNQRKMDKVYRKIVERSARGFVFQTTGAQKCYPKKVQDRSDVILNPLETAGFPTHDFTSEKKEIVTVGRLEPQKNQKILIDAFSKIANDFLDYDLTIYGEGSLRPELEEFVESKGLQNRVIWPGSKNRIQEHIKDAALFVLSSDYEGIPNALIEAMAIGLPCISTDCSPGGARELINDGENGIIVDCGNSDALAKAMVSLLEDRKKAQEMGINAKKICRRADKDLVCDRWLNLIMDCRRKVNEC